MAGEWEWNHTTGVLVTQCGRFEIRERTKGGGPPLMLLDTGRWVSDHQTWREARRVAHRLKTARAA